MHVLYCMLQQNTIALGCKTRFSFIQFNTDDGKVQKSMWLWLWQHRLKYNPLQQPTLPWQVLWPSSLRFFLKSWLLSTTNNILWVCLEWKVSYPYQLHVYLCKYMIFTQLQMANLFRLEAFSELSMEWCCLRDSRILMMASVMVLMLAIWCPDMAIRAGSNGAWALLFTHFIALTHHMYLIDWTSDGRDFSSVSCICNGNSAQY